FLLAGDRPRLALAGTRVCVRALTADRQVLAVAQAAIAAQIHETLDVHGDFAAKIALDAVLAVYGFADAHHLVIGELIDTAIGRNADLFANLPGLGAADPIDVGERDQHSFLGRNIDAGNARHGHSP